MLRFQCPACQVSLSAPEAKAGHSANCRSCGKLLRVPAAQAAALVTPPIPSKTHLGRLGGANYPPGWVVILAGIAGLVLVSGGLLIFAVMVSGPPLKTVDPPAREIKRVDLKELVAEWSDNPLVAADKYRNETLRASGRIREIDVGSGCKVVLQPAVDGGLFPPSIRVHFSEPRLIEELKKYKVGSVVEVDFVCVEIPNGWLQVSAVNISAGDS